MTKAKALFTAVPKCHNCAQAVVDGCGGTTEQVEAMATFGGGRAPEGYCGALYGALTLCPEQENEIKADFKAACGALTCKEIKTLTKTPCPECVECAARCVEKYRS